ncbi:2-(3-amino-3-carboxypropyl)histidine synthase subunit 2 [Fulvia fulva]|uniref:2-(3-amino-3-carboxypropyl)histidine synthase subunit 2 n=1 Tax=Passalora fulva TaxID=5499 RepID=A0A9Q8L822_PASFU|nr:2-(3-amino-3-carboxypropyl)histidine synthase subunit 2 [Fulvia fulva]KAK4635683.1 2-(3-amino-3-carboxypropyl)histidine synthase subunit 2 [Fulvia fulva]KAK4637736.1 2-(3-amino-3-carboxypropyl)histidine synthase subunit 2 [Fulvia fulva]UJO12577.1 2-(3-amino-3-carboxypropyl)histidine synthase subunit 2 [Fulvia fulva]WPV08165.1 2-(3-amino-3-carboxypropyl)histidine synthase subunit 2 [Fulvia fulva]WPV24424.1 2-(3-amino-3-carboxypropyl)histidine synthase subunit 2 [Fulvia fulva]
MAESAPILSTPAEHILEEPTPIAVQPSDQRLSEEQLDVQYEIHRTVNEIRAGRWKRIALQFPDDVLVDAPRVFEALRDGLKQARSSQRGKANDSTNEGVADVTTKLQETTLETDLTGGQTVPAAEHVDEKLCILGDTSYGACCVDEVAAEHVDAEIVVHYGRACLSPTARLPVIYVFTEKSLDLGAAVASFESTYPNKHDKICLMADIPYSHHLNDLQLRLDQSGYAHVFKTAIIRDPRSPLPNRTVPAEVQEDSELLKEWNVFHIATPPTSLLLILSSRIKAMYIFDTDGAGSSALAASTSQLLRRRYALITRLSTVSIFGILINTLSVSNYMDALQHCQDIIARAGKKSYVFVVGKVNAAKVANFSEIGGWVVIGCWESSLIESKDFYRPIITPFELETALTDDNERVWGSQWIGDFSQLLGKQKSAANGNVSDEQPPALSEGEGNWDDQSDDEPPEFDLRTGRYVSNSRPMGRPKPSAAATIASEGADRRSKYSTPSSALVQRAKGDLATIGGQVSPAAQFLREKREWTGLGSDYEIAYERDDDGKIRGAAMEEGRSGVAKGYHVGESDKT